MDIRLISEFIHKAIKVKRLIEQSSTIEDKAITFLQLQALEFIKKNQDATVGSLASNLAMSMSAVTQLTNRMEESSLIGRKSSKNDRRIVLLYLTEDGQKMIKSYSKQLLSKQYSIFTSLKEEDLKELIRIFTKIIASNS